METRWSAPSVRVFEAFFRPWMRRRLAGVYLTGLPVALPRDRPVVLVANHVSWWDGFLLREVHRRLGGDAPLYSLMHEAELRRFPFFRRLGVLGITPGEAGSVLHVLHFLRAARHQAPACWMSVFPQGRIWPSWVRPFGLQPGLVAFARALAPAVVVPVGLHVEALNHVRPSAFVSVGMPIEVVEGVPLDLSVVEAHLADALGRLYGLLAVHGEATPSHWPQERVPLPAGPAPAPPGTGLAPALLRPLPANG